MVVEIIVAIIILVSMFGGQYGIFIILNWYNDRGIYVKEDNNNVITLFFKLWAYIILFFSIIGIGHYIASPPIFKKRLILLMEVAFSTVIFNLVYVIWGDLLFNQIVEKYNFDILIILNAYIIGIFLMFVIYSLCLGYIRTRRFFTIENNYLKRYSQYYEGEDKLEFIKKLASMGTEEEQKEFVNNYCKIYETKKEYEADKFNLINYIYTPLIYIVLFILIQIEGILFGNLRYEEMWIIDLYVKNNLTLIISSILYMVFIISLFGIVFIQSYPYTYKSSKILNIRNRSNIQIGNKCHTVFNNVYCYRNFKEYMNGISLENRNILKNKIFKGIFIVCLILLFIIITLFSMIFYKIHCLDLIQIGIMFKVR